MGSSSDIDLALAVVKELDVGVLVCTKALDLILLSNPAGARMLESLGPRAADHGPMPLALRQAIARVLGGRNLPSHLPPALPVVAGVPERRFFVRAKALPARNCVLVLISGEVLRERELHAALVRRF